MQRNCTANHLVDILRGSKNKRVKDSEWDKDPSYNAGAAANLATADCGRVIVQLVMMQVCFSKTYLLMNVHIRD